MRSLPHSLINWPRAPRPGPHAPFELPLPPKPPEPRDQSPLGVPPVPSPFSVVLQARSERPLVRSNRRPDVTEPNRRHTYERNESLLSTPRPSTPLTAPHRSSFPISRPPHLLSLFFPSFLESTTCPSTYTTLLYRPPLSFSLSIFGRCSCSVGSRSITAASLSL